MRTMRVGAALLLILRVTASTTGDEVAQPGDAASNITPLVITSTADEISVVDVSSDGRWLLTRSGKSPMISNHQTSRIWDLSSNKPTSASYDISKHASGRMDAPSISPNGRWLVTREGMDKLYAWDLDAQDPSASPQLLAEDAFLPLQVFTGDSSWVLVRNQRHQIRKVKLPPNLPDSRPRRVIRLIFDRNYYSMNATGDRLVVYTRPSIGDEDVFQPGAMMLVDPYKDSDSILLTTGLESNSPYFSPDGTSLMVMDRERESIRLWDVMAGSVADSVRDLNGNTGRINASQISPNGQWLAAVSNGRLTCWDLSTRDVDDSVRKAELHDDRGYDIAFSKNSRWLIVAGRTGLSLWSLEEKKLAGSYFEGFLPAHISNGMGMRWLAVNALGTTRLWDMDSDNPPSSEQILDHAGETAHAVSDANGEWLTTVAVAGPLRLWKLDAEARARPVGLLRSADARFSRPMISPDGNWLIAVSHVGNGTFLGDIPKSKQGKIHLVHLPSISIK